jgi:hypothetical protein
MNYAVQVHRTTPKPKPKHSPLEIRVLVHDVASGDTIREHKINYNDPNRRRWLAKLCIWAWNNGKTVETLNVKDDG